MPQVEHQQQLNQLFLIDSLASLVFGSVSLLAPHGLVSFISGGYNHSTHEALRLYGCLRIAVGWILFHIRGVDDGRFRRSVCEGLGLCYFLQSIAVLRAQFTDQRNWINWVAIIFLTTVGFLYSRFRFGKGGDMIKVYELPSISSKMNR